MNKNLIIIILAIIIAGGAWYIFAGMDKEVEVQEENEEMVVDDALPADSIAGVWQSTEDPNSIRTIYENGGFMDTYEGMEDATTEGSWVTFTEDNAPEAFPFEVAEDTTYLALQAAEETLFFSIAELTEERLVLIYLNRGGTLEYTRVTE